MLSTCRGMRMLRFRRAQYAFRHEFLDCLASVRSFVRDTRIRSALPVVDDIARLVRGILIAVACIGLVAFGTVEGCIVSKMHAQGKPDLDYVVVLGAQVRKSGPSLVLRYRLDKAIEYLDENPNTICIVSGGKGPNEPFPEAQGMADYLKEHGIDEQRILEEPDSKTTEENIVNSKKLISDDNASVGVITNNFHMFRALQIADKYGLDNAQGIAAGSPPNMLVNNMVREFFAEIKFLL